MACSFWLIGCLSRFCLESCQGNGVSKCGGVMGAISINKLCRNIRKRQVLQKYFHQSDDDCQFTVGK